MFLITSDHVYTPYTERRPVHTPRFLFGVTEDQVPDVTPRVGATRCVL